MASSTRKFVPYLYPKLPFVKAKSFFREKESFFVLTVLSDYSAHLKILVEFKNVGWSKLKFYLYQNEESLILNKNKKYFH